MGSGISHIPKALGSTAREGESNLSSSHYTNPNQIKRSNSCNSDFYFSERDGIEIIKELLGKENDELLSARLDPTLTEEDLHALESITVPIPLNEGKRLKILRQSSLLDSNIMDPEFDRFTSLAHRIIEVRVV